MGLSRREFLIGTSAAAVTAAFQRTTARDVPLFSGTDTSQSLGERATAKGILFGTALRGEALKNVAYGDLVTRQCKIGVPEGALKWDMLRPSPDKYDFGAADYYYRFLNSHGMAYRGHTLVWEQALPSWFNNVVNAGNAKKMMLDHISTVVGHYAGKMHSWDVVNEAIEPQNGRSDGLKNTPWLQMLGPDYIEMAFRAAHEADPGARLIYNENWIEPDDRPTETKRQATLALITKLKQRGAPIHGLGIQSHLFAETFVGGPAYARFLQTVADLGLEILVTEMDIRDQHLLETIEQRDQIVAQKYYDYLAFMLQQPAVKAVLTWGLSDRYTWISQQNPRPDGSPVRPLLYDEDLKPKLAWKAVAAAFDHAPAR